MTIQACFAAWLERLPEMAALSPDGVCMETISGAGTALCATGCTLRTAFLSGMRDEVRTYRLVRRTTLLTHGARTAFLQQGEALCEAIFAADAQGALPDLSAAGASAQAVRCGPVALMETDDSGLSVAEFLLELETLR